MNRNFKSMCVFCGSKMGRNPAFVSSARDLGVQLAQQECRLIYGGGGIGLMGEVADAVLDAGGEVIGVIPDPLASKEVAHSRVTELHVVGSMHERKAMMADLSEGFIALPGGFGTFEELMEVVTWAQLGIHPHPVGILNVDGYFTRLIEFIDHAIDEEFIKPENRQLFVTAESPRALLELMATHPMPLSRQWISPSQS